MKFFSAEARLNMSLAHRGPRLNRRKLKTCMGCGKTYWNKNARKNKKYCSLKCYGNQLRKQRLGEGNSNWKGFLVGYKGIHRWIKRKLGLTHYCEFCGQYFDYDKIHFANKDHKYSRDVKDWIRICSTCHGEYDKKQKLRKRG